MSPSSDGVIGGIILMVAISAIKKLAFGPPIEKMDSFGVS